MSDLPPAPGVPPRVRPNAGAQRRRETWWIDAVHVLTLCVFAVAQPVYDLLGRNASFFVAHRASRADVVLFGVAAFIVPTAILLVARYLVSLVSRAAGHVFHLVTLAVLGALALAPPIVRAWGVHWIPATALAIAIGVAFVHFYRRSGGLRRFLSILGLATVAFPVLFLFASPVRDIVVPRALPASKPARVTVTRSEVPVIVVLFDELATTSLIAPDGEINRKRYPNFAKLVRRSTWFRDATTSGLRTDQAVPAVLTGRRVPRRQVPSAFAYPQNLFTLMAPTHELHVHESVTQLCPADLCRTASGEPTTGLGSLFVDASVVYGHLVVPPDVAGRLLPPLGDRWAGFTRDQPGAPGPGLGGGDPVKTWLRSALIAAREQNEGRLFESFLRGVRRTDRPQLSWVHVQVPHPPWRYLPSGQTYPTGNTTPGYHDFRWGPNAYLANEVLQRSLLQTKFADKMTGDLMKHLESAGLWDDTMLVVVADHGATWAPNSTRRDVDGDQRASLLGVPLIIKYPHQTKAQVDDRNAEVIDVLPTIADVTGVHVGWQTHGSSLLDRTRRGEKRVFDGKRDRTVDFSFADARRRAREIEELFGAGGGPDDLYGFGPGRDLVGRAVDDLDVDRGSPRATLAITDPEAFDEVSLEGPFLPSLLRGRFTSAETGGRRVAVAVNGHIAGVGQTFTEEGGTQISVMLSPRFFRDGRNDVDVYVIDDDALAPVRSS
jgi:sulfatase-like protein